MAHKRSQPALYELIRRRGEEQNVASSEPARPQEFAQREIVPSPARPDSRDDEHADGEPPAGGRLVRVPVGYVYVGAAAIVALAVFAYVVGHSRGEHQAKAQLDQQAVDRFNAEQTARTVSDPLGNAPSGIRSQHRDGESSTGSFVTPDRAAGDRSAGAIESDPREVGTNYYYLVYTTRLKAVEFAEFCRQNGLEAYVVHGDNPELRRVMVVPGFASGESDSDLIRDLRERIEDVITRWKLKTSNRETLTYYPEKFKG